MIKASGPLASDAIASDARGRRGRSSARRRKRWFPEQKREIVTETYRPGESVSSIARKYGISPSSLFTWKKNMEEGAFMGVTSGEAVVPTSKVREMQKRINRLEKLLGRKTEEVEVLKEAVRLGREKKLISHKPLEGVEDFQ